MILQHFASIQSNNLKTLNKDISDERFRFSTDIFTKPPVYLHRTGVSIKEANPDEILPGLFLFRYVNAIVTFNQKLKLC